MSAISTSPSARILLVAALPELVDGLLRDLAAVPEQAGRHEGAGAAQGPGARVDTDLPAAPVGLFEERKGRRQVPFPGRGRPPVVAVTSRLRRVADLEHEALGLGQIGLRQGKPSVVHVEQPAVVERPALTDAVANPA